MIDYIGKSCPYCKTAFKKDDDIVVCSVCDMPHHKDCWVENQGCTTFGCLGTIKAADSLPTTVTATTMQFEDSSLSSATIYCSRCGTPNQLTSSFCGKCGNQLKPYQNTYNNTYGGYNTSILDAEVAVYVGTKVEYYIPEFNTIKNLNKKNTWNWCAFLFAPYWFIYRKLYGYGVGILAGVFILSLIGIFGSLLSLAGYIVIGLLANYIYMRKIEKNIAQGKTMMEPYKLQHIANVGGVNPTATALTIIGYAILVTIINLV